MHGAWALSDTPGAHGSLSIPIYDSIDLATDNYRSDHSKALMIEINTCRTFFAQNFLSIDLCLLAIVFCHAIVLTHTITDLSKKRNFSRCYARLRGHFFMINQGDGLVFASDLAKNFVRAFSVREYFTADPGDPEAHGNVELAMTGGLTFAVYEAPPKRETGGGPINPFKYPLEARRRYLAAYNTLALIMAFFLLGMIYQDIANHRVRKQRTVFLGII